ncbi:hypothetical protein ACQP2F_42725 [Actinoplanes sp. CA-030573]|uniref:hypothetical protein n=1 Tax=Actinoplanes sp. CA-030573 TaxID=3239898 RepID=UPI003D94EBE4
MKLRNAIVAAALGVTGLLVAPTAAQAADHGDGKAACNSTEICFQWIWDGFTTQQYQRHFWNSDSDHTNDYFGNLPDLPNPPVKLAANAEGIFNRDSTCTVTLYMSTGYKTAYASVPRGTKQSISAWNASHKRCA